MENNWQIKPYDTIKVRVKLKKENKPKGSKYYTIVVRGEVYFTEHQTYIFEMPEESWYEQFKDMVDLKQFEKITIELIPWNTIHQK